jgi:hypothetical protein
MQVYAGGSIRDQTTSQGFLKHSLKINETQDELESIYVSKLTIQNYQYKKLEVTSVFCMTLVPKFLTLCSLGLEGALRGLYIVYHTGHVWEER